MKFKCCSKCGKTINVGVHTCSPQMIKKNLENSINKYNDKITKKFGSYAEEYIYIEDNSGDNKVETKEIQDFIELFLNKGFIGTFCIDDGIGIITIYDDEIYLGLNCFEVMKKYNIFWEDFISLYYDYIDYSIFYKDKNKTQLDLENYYLKNKKIYGRKRN